MRQSIKQNSSTEPELYEMFDRSATTHHEVYVSHFFFCAVASKAAVIK